MDPTLVSRNNAFLAAVGLIESGEARRWRLTLPGVDVARAFEYEAYDEIRDSLNSVLGANDFMQKITAFVRSRGGVEEDQVVSHMARLAGVRRAADFLTGARAVLELLVLAGMLILDGGTVQVATRAQTPGRSVAKAGTVSATVTTQGAAARGTPASSGLTLNVTVAAKDLTSDAAVDKIAARIRRLLDGLHSD